MNFKKIVLTVLVTLIFMAITSMNSYAAFDWYYCKVTGTGMGSEKEVFIMLQDTSSPARFTGRWFRPIPGQDNQTLAIALAAQTNDSQVIIYADPEAPQISRWIYTFLTYK
jgi:hypothetical protein